MSGAPGPVPARAPGAAGRPGPALAQLRQQTGHGRHDVARQPSRRAPRELGQRGQPQGGVLGGAGEPGQPAGRLLAQGLVPQGDPADRLDQREPHLRVALDGEPLPQQVQHAHRVAVQGGQRAGDREPHLPVLVADQGQEHVRAGGHGRGGHGVVGGALELLVLRVEFLQLVVAGQVDAADAGEQLHDAAPVLDVGAGRELQQERDARQRRVVDVALVVHRSVHPVQRPLALRRVVGRQAAQERGHVVGRTVGMTQRGPVDLVDPPEHAFPPRGPCAWGQ
nr:hypothetical protein [Streptomyces somaliensis]